MPPTLTLFVGHALIDLETLDLPAHAEVLLDQNYQPTEESPEVPHEVHAILDYITNREARLRVPEPATPITLKSS